MNDAQLRAMYEQINKYTGTSRLNPHFNAGYKAGFKAACEWWDSQNQQLIEALRLLVSIYDQNITGHLVEDAFNKAREIIAKAKGEQTK